MYKPNIYKSSAIDKSYSGYIKYLFLVVYKAYAKF